jgi:hypothetical protein
VSESFFRRFDETREKREREEIFFFFFSFSFSSFSCFAWKKGGKRMEGENDFEDAVAVRYVTVEIKSDAFDSRAVETSTTTNGNANKIRIDSKKTVRDLKVTASKRLIDNNNNNKSSKPTNPKYICFLYQGKVLREDEEQLEKALGLDRKKLRYASSGEEDEGDEEGNENDEDEVKIVHMIVRKSERELEREREEREKKREEERRRNSSSNNNSSSNDDSSGGDANGNVLASEQPPNATSTPQPQAHQQSPPPGVVMVSPMVMNAYNAAYNAAFRSLRPNATVVPRSPGLAYVQTNEQSTFFQQQDNATRQIGSSAVSNANTAVATVDATPNAPQGAGGTGAPVAAGANANNNDDPNVIIDPNQPYQRIVRRGENGEEIVEVIRVIQFRIDVKLMLKLILITAFACQDASKKKMAMYITAAIIGYLYQTGVLESIWDALFGAYLPPENEMQQGGGANAGANNNNNNARDQGNDNRNNIRNGRRQRYRRPANVAGYTDTMPQSWLGELKIFAYSFVASLFPAWRVPNLRQNEVNNNNNNNPQRHLHQD